MFYEDLCKNLNPRSGVIQPYIVTDEKDSSTFLKKDEILQIFHDYNIPYEYDESENAFIIYGYK